MSESASLRAVRPDTRDDFMEEVRRQIQRRIVSNFSHLQSDPLLARALLSQLSVTARDSSATLTTAPGRVSSAGTLNARLEDVVSTIDMGLLATAPGDDHYLFERGVPTTVPAEWMAQLRRSSSTTDPDFVMPDITEPDYPSV